MRKKHPNSSDVTHHLQLLACSSTWDSVAPQDTVLAGGELGTRSHSSGTTVAASDLFSDDCIRSANIESESAVNSTSAAFFNQ